MTDGAPTAEDLRSLYLDTLRRALTGSGDTYPYRIVKRPKPALEAAIFDALQSHGIDLVTRAPPGHDLHREGGGWPVAGVTMLGERRLEHLQGCVEAILDEEVPGDLIETGVWRGGATILMRGVLRAHGVTDRRVWVADSFEGVPAPDAERFPADRGDRLHTQPALAVTLDEVKADFEAYGLLDEQVRFLPGWFRDTLPGLEYERWSLVRLDGDLYESTLIALEHLYPSLAPEGFLIVDDYGAMPACKAAVEHFREDHGITEPLETIDWTGVAWRKR